MNRIKILEISACCNKQAEKKLSFKANSVDRMYAFMKDIIQKDSYDILSIREICWNAIEKLNSILEGYKFYIHKDFENVEDRYKSTYSCLSVAFVKDTIEFNQLYTSDNFHTTLRYVFGEIKFSNQLIYFKTTHIPCANYGISDHVSRKKSMLLDELEFQKKYDNTLAISSGDFNGCNDSRYYCSDIYGEFVFKDLIQEPTYENKCLDHVFVSKTIDESPNIKVETKVLDDFYMKYTDHKLISITITSNDY